MKFGILKDIKEGEYRVICTPFEVMSIVASGHELFAEHDCGKYAGFPDEKYVEAGAKILNTAKEVWDTCDMVAKV
jgi:alanine dehydrogenase